MGSHLTNLDFYMLAYFLCTHPGCSHPLLCYHSLWSKWHTSCLNRGGERIYFQQVHICTWLPESNLKELLSQAPCHGTSLWLDHSVSPNTLQRRGLHHLPWKMIPMSKCSHVDFFSPETSQNLPRCHLCWLSFHVSLCKKGVSILWFNTLYVLVHGNKVPF